MYSNSGESSVYRIGGTDLKVCVVGVGGVGWGVALTYYLFDQTA